MSLAFIVKGLALVMLPRGGLSSFWLRLALVVSFSDEPNVITGGFWL